MSMETKINPSPDWKGKINLAAFSNYKGWFFRPSFAKKVFWKIFFLHLQANSHYFMTILASSFRSMTLHRWGKLQFQMFRCRQWKASFTYESKQHNNTIKYTLHQEKISIQLIRTFTLTSSLPFCQIQSYQSVTDWKSHSSHQWWGQGFDHNHSLISKRSYSQTSNSWGHEVTPVSTVWTCK